jgi:hypothetical protein
MFFLRLLFGSDGRLTPICSCRKGYGYPGVQARDRPRAVALYDAAARRLDPEAAFSLGVLWELGLGDDVMAAAPWPHRRAKAMTLYAQCAGESLACWLALAKLRWLPAEYGEAVNTWLCAAGWALGLSADDPTAFLMA